MAGKCPHCKKVPYPYRDEITKKLIWKNILHVDWLMLIITICILFSAWAYAHDTAECRQLVSDPCKYINVSLCNMGLIDGLGQIYTPILDEEAG